MIDKNDITIGDRFSHPKGSCMFTEVAFALEAMNPDPTSIFVLFDGTSDEVEVTLSLLSVLDDIPKICNLCLRDMNGNDSIKSNICVNCIKRLAELGEPYATKRTNHNDTDKII